MKNKKSQYDVTSSIIPAPLTDKGQLTTNYPFGDIKEKHRKYLEQPIFYVNSKKTGLTIAKFHNLIKAMRFLEKIDGVLCPWQPSDEQMDVIQAEERKLRQIEFTGPHRPLVQTKRRKPRKIFSKE